MRVLEEPKEDAGFNAIAQLAGVKVQKEALKVEMDQVVKANEDVGTNIEKLSNM